MFHKMCKLLPNTFVFIMKIQSNYEKVTQMQPKPNLIFCFFFFHEGVQSTMTLSKTSSSPYGVSFKVVPVSTQVYLNKVTCFQLNGTKEAPASTTNVMPDLTGFKVWIFYWYFKILTRAGNCSYFFFFF